MNPPLTMEDARNIRRLAEQERITVREICQLYRRSAETIRRILRQETFLEPLAAVALPPLPNAQTSAEKMWKMVQEMKEKNAQGDKMLGELEEAVPEGSTPALEAFLHRNKAD